MKMIYQYCSRYKRIFCSFVLLSNFTILYNANCFSETEVILTGGSTIGNGGGQDEINVFYQILNLPKHLLILQTGNHSPEVHYRIDELLNFNFDSLDIIFIDNPSNRGPRERLFNLNSNKLQVHSNVLSKMSEESEKTEMNLNIIAEFIKVVPTQSKQADIKILELIKYNITDLIAVNMIHLGYSNAGLAYIDLPGDQSFFISGSKKNLNITTALLANLYCIGGSPEIKSATIPSWRDQLPAITNNSIEAYVEFEITYECNQNLYSSSILIELKYEVDKKDIRIENFKINQWNIEAL